MYKRSEIKILIRKTISVFLHIFFIFPIRKHRIIFESYEGKSYSCNPKYISEYLLENYDKKPDIIWAFRVPEKYKDIPGIRIVKYYSIRWLYYRITSKILVYNANLYTYIPKRKQQIYINTWHAGGAYKRVGLEQGIDPYADWSLRTLTCKNTDYYVSSSKQFSKYNIFEAHGKVKNILKCGMPRNDIFFNDDIMKRIRRKVRKQFNEIDSIIVLYAPTFRGTVHNATRITYDIPYKRIVDVLEKRYGKKVSIWVRMHYLDVNSYMFEKNIIDVSNYPDMQELLCASDILITDYSSSIWDYALIKKPCLLYVPDLNLYKKTERDFFTPIDEWPGIVCINQDSLIQKLKEISTEEAVRIASEHLKKSGSYEKGTASKVICDIIMRNLYE